MTKFYLEKLKSGSWGNKTVKDALFKAVDGLTVGRWCVTIERYKKTRSLGQNKFYWNNFVTAQIECFKERFGETYTKEQVHDFNKVNVWGSEKLIEETGEVIKIPESSTKQSTVEWEAKLEGCRAKFRQLFEWELPYPLEQGEIF